MKKQSAGILPFRFTSSAGLEVMLAHPGGPFWKNKDEGSWSIVKGEFMEPEEPLVAAIREFSEETTHHIEGTFITLTPVLQKSGKTVYAFAVEATIDSTTIVSNHFEMEWPPRSGKKQSFPEIDRAEWFNLEMAIKKINPAQSPLLEELALMLNT